MVEKAASLPDSTKKRTSTASEGRPSLSDLLTAAGTSLDEFFKTLLRLTNAKKHVYFQKGGVITGVREVDNHFIQMRAAEALLGAYKAVSTAAESEGDKTAQTSSFLKVNLGCFPPNRAIDLARVLEDEGNDEAHPMVQVLDEDAWH